MKQTDEAEEKVFYRQESKAFSASPGQCEPGGMRNA